MRWNYASNHVQASAYASVHAPAPASHCKWLDHITGVRVESNGLSGALHGKTTRTCPPATWPVLLFWSAELRRTVPRGRLPPSTSTTTAAAVAASLCAQTHRAVASRAMNAAHGGAGHVYGTTCTADANGGCSMTDTAALDQALCARLQAAAPDRADSTQLGRKACANKGWETGSSHGEI